MSIHNTIDDNTDDHLRVRQAAARTAVTASTKTGRAVDPCVEELADASDPRTFWARHAVSTVFFVLGLCLGFIAGIGTILIVDEAVGLDQPEVVHPTPASLSSDMGI